MNNAYKCYILGAGFSRGFSDAAPVAAGFLAAALKSGKFDPTAQHRELGQLYKLFYNEDERTNVEDLASFLTSPLADSSEETAQRGTAYDQLVNVISETLSSVHHQPSSEEVKQRYRSFAQRVLRDGSCVLSFNYDLILEHLFFEEGDEWHPFDGYGLAIPQIGPRNLSPVWTRISSPIERGPALASRPLLLKLHGSLSWGRRKIPYPDGSNPVEQTGIFNPHEVPKRMFSVTSTGSGDISGLGYSTEGYKYHPYIIPPVFTKSGFYSDPLTNNIWHLARGALRACAEIIMIGYSLPPADFEAIRLLRESIATNKIRLRGQKINVTLVNPSMEVYERLKSFLEVFENVNVIHRPVYSTVYFEALS
jgi:hypothetical protein